MEFYCCFEDTVLLGINEQGILWKQSATENTRKKLVCHLCETVNIKIYTFLKDTEAEPLVESVRLLKLLISNQKFYTLL